MTTLENYEKVSAAEFRRGIGDFVNRAGYGNERTVCARNKKPHAALVSIEDLKILTALESAGRYEELKNAVKEGEDIAKYFKKTR